jgi:hypothetical protein
MPLSNIQFYWHLHSLSEMTFLTWIFTAANFSVIFLQIWRAQPPRWQRNRIHLSLEQKIEMKGQKMAEKQCSQNVLDEKTLNMLWM